MNEMCALLCAGELIGCFASWQKEQHVGRVCDLQIVSFAIATQHGMFIFVPSDHQAAK